MLFLVQGTVERRDYMVDKPSVTNPLRIVEAEDENEAEKKYTEHYEGMSSSYNFSYWVTEVEATAVIK